MTTPLLRQCLLPVSPSVRREVLPDVPGLIYRAAVALQSACPAMQVMARHQMMGGRELNIIDNRIGALVCQLQKDNPGRIREAMAASEELAWLKRQRTAIKLG